MTKHTALLLGCGTIGAEVARLLVADEVFSSVLTPIRMSHAPNNSPPRWEKKRPLFKPMSMMQLA
jgi:hypothetical protein